MDPEAVGGPPPVAETPAAPATPATPATPAATSTAAASRPATLQDIAEAEAKKQGVDPRLVHAVINTESSWNPAARSPAGAIGLMQLMPATAKKWGVDPTDPVQNIRGGVSELKALAIEHKGDVAMMLRRYNGSPAASPEATQPYVDKVLSQIKPSTAPTPGEDPAAPAPTPAPAPAPKAGTPPPAPPETWGAWALRQGKDIASSFDPRTKGGRQNLAGAAGAAGLTALATATAPVSVPLLGFGAAATGVTGAFLGGEAADLGEQVVGNAPPSTASAFEAGGAQGGQEALGHTLMWPVQAVGRRMVASRVGHYAADALSVAKTATLTKLQSALDASRDLLRRTQATTKEANAQAATSTRQIVTSAANKARQGVQAASDLGEDRVATAQANAAQGVSQAEGAAAQGEAAARAPYEAAVGAPPPSSAAAGRAANEVIQTGGAAQARNLAGKAVDAAAASGPDVDISALKDEARKVVEGQIRPPEASFPRRSAGEAGEAEVKALAASANMKPELMQELADKAAANPDSAAAKNYAQYKKMHEDYVAAQPEAQLSQAQLEGQKETLKHPAMAVLQRILNAGDTVPFKDAHLWKVELDNAIRNTRDQSVKSQVSALTQKFAGSLRSTLRAAGHQPYEDATAAYAKIAPLYTKGYAAQLKKVVTENPESVVAMLNPGQPTKAKMLVDLLTTQAAEGGDEAGGRAALEAVQSAWVRKKIIDGGIEKLSERIDKIPPEFKAAFLSDPKAKAVLDNLKLMSTAYKTALLTGEQGVEAATAAGKGSVSAVKDLAAQRVGAAREAGQQSVQAARTAREGVLAQTRQAGAAQVEQAASAITPAQTALRASTKGFRGQERALVNSSLGRAMQPGAAARTGADILRAMALGPHSIWGGLSILRILHGPTANDLVHYAATSPVLTRAVVKAMTSPVPGEALAGLVRSWGLLNEVKRVGAKGGSAIKSRVTGAPPPPAAQGVGAPPPS
jgi:Transglycosylase SLT domain